MNFATFSGKREFSANAGKIPLVGGGRGAVSPWQFRQRCVINGQRSPLPALPVKPPDQSALALIGSAAPDSDGTTKVQRVGFHASAPPSTVAGV